MADGGGERAVEPGRRRLEELGPAGNELPASELPECTPPELQRGAPPEVGAEEAECEVGLGSEVTHCSVPCIEVAEGLHGPVYAPSLNRIYLSTLSSLEGINVSETTLTAANKIPWDVDGLAGGRNARPRVASDGNFVYGVASSVVKPEAWADRRNDIHIADLKAGTAKRLTLDKGIAIRFQLSTKYAMFVNLHPGGDHAYFFDVDPKSPGFQKIAAKVKLDPLANPPVAGKPATGTETRGAALTPDGKWGFVSHGGEGLISVVDTSKQQVVNKVKVPTALKGGGYLIAVQHGAPLIDLIGR